MALLPSATNSSPPSYSFSVVNLALLLQIWCVAPLSTAHIPAKRRIQLDQSGRSRHHIALDVAGSASTAIATTSWSLVLIFLLDPALLHRVPQFSAVRALSTFTMSTECLSRAFSLHLRLLVALTLDVHAHC